VDDQRGHGQQDETAKPPLIEEMAVQMPVERNPLGLLEREHGRNKATGRRADEIYLLESEPIRHDAEPLGRCLQLLACRYSADASRTSSRAKEAISATAA
jgi:hypothetical protein